MIGKEPTVVEFPLAGGAAKQVPRRIIIHSMAEYVPGSPSNQHATELLKALKLSVHALIAPDGTIIRCRQDWEGAYHAKGHNENSLGVEFLVPGVYDYGQFLKRIKTPYLTKEQYASGVYLVSHWAKQYAILDIQRHSDVDPSRKYDPGNGFPWTSFLSDIK